jgi:hypothetical protein
MQDLAPDAMRLSRLQQARLDAVAEGLARLNAAIAEAVEAGLSIELQRAARHHCGSGHWGDLMMPVVVKRG